MKKLTISFFQPLSQKLLKRKYEIMLMALFKACEYKAKRRNNVKRHLLSKHQQLNIECPNCYKIYKNQRGFDRHPCVKPDH